MKKMFRLLVISILLLTGGTVVAQQGAASGPALAIRSSLPKGYVRQPYEAQLAAGGGLTPYSWEVTEGKLPAGLTLQRNGVISGIPSESGSFHFAVTVTDGGKPAQQLTQRMELLVVAPLMLQWNKPPKVNGRRIEGSVTVANQTEHDFDLTVVMLAVNETGRATAIGYQHLKMKGDTTSLEAPFGENLPVGTYQLNVDAVAEGAASGSIYRARLVQDGMQVTQGP